MKVLDVNLLLYAYDSEARSHEPAKEWLEGALSASEAIGLAWVTLLGFIRISTSPNARRMRWSVERAFDTTDEWLAQPAVRVIHPTHRHAAIVRDLLAPLGAGGNLTTDAHLAALAIEHGATLYSSDNDFSRFPGLSWVDPLHR